MMHDEQAPHLVHEGAIKEVMPTMRSPVPGEEIGKDGALQVLLVFFDEQGREVLRTDALVLRQRMLNSLHYVLERAYDQDWTYQRFARARALERINKAREVELSPPPE